MLTNQRISLKMTSKQIKRKMNVGKPNSQKNSKNLNTPSNADKSKYLSERIVEANQ